MSTQFTDGFTVPYARSTWGNRFGVHDIINGRDVYGPEGHRGTDFKVPVGTPVPSPGIARVERILHSVALGNVIVLRHFLHGDNNDIYTGFAHLSATSVQEGRWVKTGQTVAKSGDTGTACYGPHVHMTMGPDLTGVISGRVFDPIDYMLAHGTIDKPTTSAKYLTARRGEGLIAIATRAGISFDRVRALNPGIRQPDYLVLLGQKIRVG